MATKGPERFSLDYNYFLLLTRCNSIDFVFVSEYRMCFRCEKRSVGAKSGSLV